MVQQMEQQKEEGRGQMELQREDSRGQIGQQQKQVDQLCWRDYRVIRRMLDGQLNACIPIRIQHSHAWVAYRSILFRPFATTMPRDEEVVHSSLMLWHAWLLACRTRRLALISLR